MPKGRSGGFVQDSISTSLFSTTVGDRWSPLQPYSTSALRFPSPPSVDFVDSSPLWEPYMPLLEKRCPKGGVVASYRTMTSTSIFLHPSVNFVDSSPRWEPYMPLLEERCPKGGVVASYRTASRRHFSALPRATNGRPYDSIPLSQNSKKRSQ